MLYYCRNILTEIALCVMLAYGVLRKLTSAVAKKKISNNQFSPIKRHREWISKYYGVNLSGQMFPNKFFDYNNLLGMASLRLDNPPVGQKG